MFYLYYTIGDIEKFKGVVVIVNNIKLLRAYKGVSQKEVADAIGISQQTLSKVENSDNMNLKTAKKIADYFGVGLDDIFLNKNTIKTCFK
ncbi:MAG: helix-turn-helix transcriptional regulator [Anaerococcus vaginalis]|nr:helix-turn-helix transcriptional regulator [Anaerococcus vaginalis]